MTLTDDILRRYADGELDAETAAAVATALVHDNIAAERVRLLTLSGKALAVEAARGATPAERDALARRFLGTGGTETTPHAQATVRPLPEANSHRPVVRSRAWQALAAGLLLAIGLGIGFASGTRQREASAHPVWVMRVVDYHTLYGRSTVAGSDAVAAAEVAGMERRFADALGRPMKIPAYAGATMEFRRGQILEFERAPIIQLAYLPKEGTPMALCLKRAEGADTQPAFERVHGIGMVRWRRGGLDYVLVGNQTAAELQGYAQQAIEQIAAAVRT